MRTYEASQFAITFNGDLVSVDVDWELLTKYIVAKYKPLKHYVDNDETFFTLNMTQFDQDEICEDMDEFCILAEMSDDDLIFKLNGLLAIASPAVKKAINDNKPGTPARNVPDAGAVEQPNVQEKQADVPKPGPKPRTDNSIF